MSTPDRDMHELLQPLRAAEPSEERPREGLDRAVEEAKAVTRRRRRWKRRFGPPAGLAVGLLVVGTAAAAATGILTFGGLSGSTSNEDDSAPGLRVLVGQLVEQETGAGGPIRTGMVSRDGIDVLVALTTERMCISAPGQHASGKDYYDLRPRGNAERRMPNLGEIPRAAGLRGQPTQVSCVSARRLEGTLPAITGSDERGGWIVVLAPDQVASVRGTSATGETPLLEQVSNLAVGRARSRFTKVSWLTTEGTAHEFTFDVKQPE